MACFYLRRKAYSPDLAWTSHTAQVNRVDPEMEPRDDRQANKRNILPFGHSDVLSSNLASPLV